ncbi:hypothetical protein Aph01nite_63360 [Acrocarpospora phusangensis]|uniref:Rod shape-determining protein MreD n=1 Tax=Acrocarpospora phusangensis TaxID=1070424 RepID=A0A919QHL4_9ACTN|nr:rod shape-determining protein MreD [Acrocarpospora phusangensis]GIH28026.1 hypothetical protein Aph01nite_63360 [Acrocarpospora phusangensis]
MARNLGTIVLLFFALVLQVTVVNRLGFPVTPDLVLLVVIALATLRGPLGGAVIGFLTGLAADLAPPADHVLGQYALVMCVTGYLAGRWANRVPMLSVAVCAAGAPALAVGVGSLLGDPGVDWNTFVSLWPGAALCNLLAAPIVVWIVHRLYRPARRRDVVVVGRRRW